MHAIPFTFLLYTSNHSRSHTHTLTGTETWDADPSADPAGNADTGLPICYGSLRQRGGRQRGREIRGTEKARESILTTQRFAQMLVVGPAATVFLIDDLCWIDTF